MTVSGERIFAKVIGQDEVKSEQGALRPTTGVLIGRDAETA